MSVLPLLSIGKYCGFGFQMDGLITSKSNEVTVQFMSGMHTSGRGFLAAYSTTDKSGIYNYLVIVLVKLELPHKSTELICLFLCSYKVTSKNEGFQCITYTTQYTF